MKLIAPLACCLMVLTWAAGSAAQTERRSTQIWRCGPEGRDLREAPCPGQSGSAAKPLDYDRPTPARQDEARAIAKRDAKLAKQLEKERLSQQADAAPPAAGIHGRGRPASAPASAKGEGKPFATKKPKTGKPKPPKTHTSGG